MRNLLEVSLFVRMVLVLLFFFFFSFFSFFADNSLLFCHANLEELNIIQGMSLYKKASGQQIIKRRPHYSLVSVPDGRKEEIKNLLGVLEIKEYEKYLGIPTTVGRNKKASLNYIKGWVWNKLRYWKEKLLSQAGREIFFKAVVQAIPTFAMSCFKLPLGLCHNNTSWIQILKFNQKNNELM